MARVTVEDCVEKVPSRFELVVLAAKRARQISAGSALTVDRENDKNTVVALREIAEESIELEQLRDSLVASYRQYSPVEENEEELEDLLEKEFGASDQRSGRSLKDGWIPDSAPPQGEDMSGGSLSAEMAALEAELDAALMGASGEEVGIENAQDLSEESGDEFKQTSSSPSQKGGVDSE